MLRIALSAALALTACVDQAELGEDDDTEPGQVVVTETSITIIDTIRFAHGSGLLDEGNETVDAVASTMIGGPITKLAVVGHVDRDEPGGVVLATARAQAIVDALVARGVPAETVEAEPGDEPSRGIELLIVTRDADD